MSGMPLCPYCGTDLGEPIPNALQGIIQLRCPACSRLYEYSEELGSLPIDIEPIYHLSSGLFRRKIAVGSQNEDIASDDSSRLSSYLCFCLLSPILVLLLILMINNIFILLFS